MWPLSRTTRSKPSLSLVDERTMFQVSVERLDPLFDPEHIFVITGEEQVQELREQVPAIPATNYIVEPARRDTGPAAGLGTLYIAHQDPEAVIAVLTADHYISDTAKFRKALEAARKLALRDYIVAMGISATFPSPAFAYLRRGKWIDEVDGFSCYQATQLHEKPDPAVAAQLLLSGNYSWNSGMLVWRGETALQAFRKQCPELGDVLDHIEPAIGTPTYETALHKWFPKTPALSFDKAIMQNAENMVVLTVDIGWSDVGTWATLYDVLKSDRDSNKNVVRSDASHTLHLDTKRTFIISERVVVTIGVEDLIIIDTEDVLLVCRRDKSEEVRRVVQMLKDLGLEDYL